LTNWKLDERKVKQVRKEHVAYVMLDCAYKEAGLESSSLLLISFIYMIKYLTVTATNYELPPD